MEPEKLFSIITISVMLGMVILLFLVKFLKECLIPIWRERAEKRRERAEKRREAREPKTESEEHTIDAEDGRMSKHRRLLALLKSVNLSIGTFGVRIKCANYGADFSVDGFPDIIDPDCDSPYVIYAEASESSYGIKPDRGSGIVYGCLHDNDKIHRERLHAFQRRQKWSFDSYIDEAIGWLERFRDDCGEFGLKNLYHSIDAFHVYHREKSVADFLRGWGRKLFEEKDIGMTICNAATDIPRAPETAFSLRESMRSIESLVNHINASISEISERVYICLKGEQLKHNIIEDYLPASTILITLVQYNEHGDTVHKKRLATLSVQEDIPSSIDVRLTDLCITWLANFINDRSVTGLNNLLAHLKDGDGWFYKWAQEFEEAAQERNRALMGIGAEKPNS